MKSSVYKLTQGVYLADLDGRQIKRGSVEDLAGALVEAGIVAGDLLLGDWREGAELLSSSEQDELRATMKMRPDRQEPAPGLDSYAAGDPAI
jgi:hypothetical protein